MHPQHQQQQPQFTPQQHPQQPSSLFHHHLMMQQQQRAAQSSQQPQFAYATPTASTSSTASTSTRASGVMERRLNPPALPPQMLSGFEDHSMEKLCTLGKELVLELMTRMMSIVCALKMDIKGDNKKDLDIVRIQLDYSTLIFLALTEIQLRIDLKLTKRGDTRPTDEQLLRMLEDNGDDTVDGDGGHVAAQQAEKLAQLAATFERNRVQLVRMSGALKKLEWVVICADPMATSSHGRKSDGSSSSSRRPRSD